MPGKHAIIIAHPARGSFTHAMASAYRDAAVAAGELVVIRDLYDMKFDPCLPEQELPWAKAFHVREDVVAERRLLEKVETFALFYPLWLNAPPAILKGYLDRVFGYGFAYGRGTGGNVPLLAGKRLVVFTSSGAPIGWLKSSGAWQAIHQLFDQHFAAVCGLRIDDHIHFGGIVSGIRADVVDECRQKVRQTFEAQMASAYI